MENKEWPGGFIPATDQYPGSDGDEDVTIFIEDGVRYCNGGERTQEYLYMEDMPIHLENRC